MRLVSQNIAAFNSEGTFLGGMAAVSTVVCESP